MANEGEFPEQGVYARLLVEPRVLRRLAMGLIVLGMGIIPTGVWADAAGIVTVGMIVLVTGGAWLLWLTIPGP